MNSFDSMLSSFNGLLGLGVAGHAAVAAIDAAIVLGVLVAFAVAASLLERGVKKLLITPIGPGGKPLVGARRVDILEGHLTFPGVVYHECSHALFAMLFGAKVTGMSVIPVREEDGSTTLGSVTFITRGSAPLRSLQMAMSAVAPAITGFAGMAALILLAFPACTAWWHWVLAVYAFICLLFHSELSDQDVRTGRKGIPFLVVLLLLVFLIFPVTPGAFGLPAETPQEMPAPAQIEQVEPAASDAPPEEEAAEGQSENGGSDTGRSDWTGDFSGQVVVGR